MSMSIRTNASAVGAIVLAAAALSAHHNMSAMFDFDQRFTRTGLLSKADWRNPHIYLHVDVKDDQGKVESWSFEGPAPNFFRARNLGREAFEKAIGKPVTVEASRARDGSLSGLIRVVKLPDGTEISLCPQNC
jgi:hypothetical protein